TFDQPVVEIGRAAHEERAAGDGDRLHVAGRLADAPAGTETGDRCATRLVALLEAPAAAGETRGVERGAVEGEGARIVAVVAGVARDHTATAEASHQRARGGAALLDPPPVRVGAADAAVNAEEVERA